jgi:catechol 2,3-dioxygenase-like lactoylglutathione lyase family enzyme
MLVRDFKSIVLTSQNPDKTAAFYRDLFGIPLEEEQHRGTDRHFACRVGDLHFAIHPREGFWLPTSSAAEAGTIVSFNVEDLDALVSHLAARGVEITARNTIGPMSFIAVRDPDGRHVCCGTLWPGSKRA